MNSPPFDVERYKHLMSGLEVSEISLSEVKKDNDRFRFDAEYFKKEYLNAYSTIYSLPYKKLEDIISSLTDFHSNGSYETIAENYELLDEPSYAYMIRTTDLENKNYYENIKYVDKASYEFLAKSKVFGGEVVINKIGSPGKTYYVPHLNIPMSLGMNLFMLTTNNTINNECLFIYLNSKYGIKIMERNINGAVPLSIDKVAIKNLPIPIFSDEFNKKLAEQIIISENLEKQSTTLYNSASSLLLSELGLKDFNPSNKNISIKTLKDSFLKTGRLDAEYYQAKYEELQDKLKTLKTEKLGKLVKINKSIEPGSDLYRTEGVPFIRVQDLSKWGIANSSVYLPSEYASSLNIKPEKNTILLSKDGTCGIAYKVQKDMDAITSGAILHLKVKNEHVLLPDYLCLLLNSLLVQLQAERDIGGSIIRHWRPDQIKEVIIPIIDTTKQEEISSMCQKSFALKIKADALLQDAIKQVEEKIENSNKDMM